MFRFSTNINLLVFYKAKSNIFQLEGLKELMFSCRIDCVGILKLRNADVEQRIGVPFSKKKSTKARLVFRSTVPKPDGGFQTLQVASTPISCSEYFGVYCLKMVCNTSLLWQERNQSCSSLTKKNKTPHPMRMCFLNSAVLGQQNPSCSV